MIPSSLQSVLLLAATIGIFAASSALQRRLQIVLFHPILITILAMILLLRYADVSFEQYHDVAGRYIDFWLKPAIVALGVPLYRQFSTIRPQIMPILASQLAGCIAGLLTVVLIAGWLGAMPQVAISMAPKSVTTPIAIEVSKTLGGIPPLTAAVVVTTGIFGAMFGFSITRLCRITSPIAASLAVGTATHAVGTSAAMSISQRYGAYSSLGLTLNGILTAILAPYILSWIS